MANANPSFHQYEPLRVPKEWTGEEKKFIQQLSDIFDDIYRRYGRLRIEDMGEAFRNRIISDEGAISEIEQTAENIRLEVGTDKVYRAASEAVLIAALGAKTPPVEMAVGLLWLDTTTNLIKRCTAVTPLTWASVQVDEVHTAGIDISPGALSLWASLSYNMVAGTGTSAVGMSNDRPDTAFMWAGNADPALAPFRVNMDGSIYAKNLQQVYSQSYWDMADDAVPAAFDVFIPSGYTMDSVAFTFKTGKARTFAKGAASGGGQTSGSGGAGEKTSRNGGGESISSTANNNSTGSATGDTGSPSTEYTGVSSGNTANAGTGNTGGSSATNTGETNNAASGGMTTSPDTGYAGSGATGGSSVSISGSTGYKDGAGSHNHPVGTLSGGSHTHTGPSHRHSITAHTHYSNGGTHSHSIAHTHAGPSHSHGLNDHTHSLNGHVHSLGAHTHDMNSHTHTVEVSAHTHIVDIDAHTHTIDAHTHDLDYGINEKTALATSCVLTVNGTTIGTYSPNPANTLEIKAYLAAGWNSITVQPNDDARISAYTMVKITAQ